MFQVTFVRRPTNIVWTKPFGFWRSRTRGTILCAHMRVEWRIL